MLIPSIDLMGKNAVQLVQGRIPKINAGNPFPIAESFSLAGEIAVIDLDAALGQGSNLETIKQLCKKYQCRVGGGIRNLDLALELLDSGAEKIILGTMAKPEFLKNLPPKRIIAALDSWKDEVVVEGWKTKTGTKVADKISELSPYVDGFMVTFVENEGKMQGLERQRVEKLRVLMPSKKLTVAGGAKSVEDIAMADELGVDTQVGMALYDKSLSLADAIAAPLISKFPRKLWPTIVSDEHGITLGLTWSNIESLRAAVQKKKGIYHSRKRGLWEKGLESGATQDLLKISLDCDRDALKFTVIQSGDGFCHKKTRTCFGEDEGLSRLTRLLKSRYKSAPEGSWTKKLFENPDLLDKKIKEEGIELSEAKTPKDIRWEAADVIYFTLTKCIANGISLSDIEKELYLRSLKTRRRN